MLDINSEEKLVKMVGGKFRLTSLIQKRIVDLNRGSPPWSSSKTMKSPPSAISSSRRSSRARSSWRFAKNWTTPCRRP